MKPNYQFERRRRDLAKKQKQEQKRLRKQAGRTEVASAAGPAAEAPGTVVPPERES